MNEYSMLIKCCVYGFFVTLAISPFVISFIKKEKVKQVILNYVESHESKSGTPTMGGIIFLISISVVALICFEGASSLAKLSLVLFIAYGLVGFLDDFIKFKFRRNMGLRAYQKIVFQLLVSVFAGFYAYKSNLVGGVLVIPFTDYVIDIGAWVIPLIVIIYLATTNAVNLTDGLDGLATSTTLTYMISFIALVYVLFEKSMFAGVSEIHAEEIKNIAKLASVTCGGMLCFLVFNCFPAKIFMGDTGSLALGSLVASVAVFSNMSLYIPILGFMFVASAVSVIMQVSYYKLTKKRIFLMAPLHHHFEKSGWSEKKVFAVFTSVSLIFAVISLLGVMSRYSH